MQPGQDRPFFDLLPEIYKRDKVLDALLSVFEEQYLDIERAIDKFPEELYDPLKAPAQLLEFLQRLVGMHSGSYIFHDDELRYLIPRAYMLQRRKGTRHSLQIMLNSYLMGVCGHKPKFLIVEYRDWCSYSCAPDIKSRYEKEFGGETRVKIFILKNSALEEEGQMSRLRALVDEYSPAMSDVEIITLDSLAITDEGSFLGYNAYLGGTGDGESAV